MQTPDSHAGTGQELRISPYSRSAPNAAAEQATSATAARPRAFGIQARETIALKRRMEELIAQHTGQPLEKVAEDMERVYFLSAENAVVYGIIDGVLTHRFA